MNATLICAALLVLQFPVAAQYSFNGTYDDGKPVTVSGTVTKVLWRNPHSHVYLDVKNTDGTTTAWNLDLAGAALLASRGLGKGSFQLGDRVTVEGFLAREPEQRAYGRTLTLSDGKAWNIEPETVWHGCRTIALTLPAAQFPADAVIQNRVCASMVHDAVR